ncbi:hypothetical protein [Sphingobium yanoikuyae]|uniref:hypothetical protein n=1 Tax=Sphingobium yanoikuyae TaxID=13690 RepID=UPI0031E31A9B
MKNRIAFLISDQHLIPQSEIGQFARGFCEMAARNDCVVDLILETETLNTFFEHNGLTIAPDTPLPDTGHKAAFAFNDSFSLERAANYRKATMKTFQSNLYDMVMMNSLEAYMGFYGLDLARFIPSIFYHHSGNVKSQAPYQSLYDNLSQTRYVIFATQTLAEHAAQILNQDDWMPWQLLLDNFDAPMSKSNAARINTWQSGTMKAFIKTLGRFASTEDIISILNNRHKFSISYTNTDTILTNLNRKSEHQEHPLIEFPLRVKR